MIKFPGRVVVLLAISVATSCGSDGNGEGGGASGGTNTGVNVDALKAEFLELAYAFSDKICTATAACYPDRLTASEVENCKQEPRNIWPNSLDAVFRADPMQVECYSIQMEARRTCVTKVSSISDNDFCSYMRIDENVTVNGQPAVVYEVRTLPECPEVLSGVDLPAKNCLHIVSRPFAPKREK